MANCCFTQICCLAPTEEDAEAFIKALTVSPKRNELEWFGRVQDMYVSEDIEPYKVDGKLYYRTVVDCDVAWSLSSSVRTKYSSEGNVTLEEFAQKHKCYIEAYSEECGFEFQEHFACGPSIGTEATVFINEERDWQCMVFSSEDELADYNAENNTDIKWEDLDDGEIEIGGYPDWEFEIEQFM